MRVPDWMALHQGLPDDNTQAASGFTWSRLVRRDAKLVQSTSHRLNRSRRQLATSPLSTKPTESEWQASNAESFVSLNSRAEARPN